MPAAEALQSAFASIKVKNPATQRALESLATWNGQNAASSAEAA